MATKVQEDQNPNGETETKPRPAKAVVPATERGAVRPADIDGAWRLCQALAKSSLLPTSFTEKAGRGSGAPIQFSMEERVANVFLAVQMGAEVGLTAMQAIQSIAVINNRPSLWGDGLIGVVRASGICKYITETIDGDGDHRTAWCGTQRSDTEEIVKRSFSWDDAKKANLTGKGPWKSYPDRMLAMRARAFCLRDAYADVLKGLHSADELADMGTLEAQPDGTYKVQSPTARPQRENPAPVEPDDAGHEELDQKFADTVGNKEPRKPADDGEADSSAVESSPSDAAADDNPKEDHPSSDASGAPEEEEAEEQATALPDLSSPPTAEEIANTISALPSILADIPDESALFEWQATFDPYIFAIEKVDKEASSQLDAFIQERLTELTGG